MTLFTVASYFSLAFGVAESREGVLWRSVRISHPRLIVGARRNGSYSLKNDLPRRLYNHTCSLSCLQVEWCNLWCPDPSSISTCLFFDMFVVEGYKEVDMTNALPCFTRKPKDFAVGATIEGALAHPTVPSRVKENLIDGIFDFENASQCYYGSDCYDPWLKLDLGSVKPIRRIMFMPKCNDDAKNCYNIVIRVGTENFQESEFGSQKLFGYFPGPAKRSQEILLESPAPAIARYVLIQRLSDRIKCNPDGSTNISPCQLTLCHIEISY